MRRSPSASFIARGGFVVAMDAPLRFADRRTWRAWLAANHDNARTAWLLITKKAVKGGLHYEEALEEALCYGWIDGQLRSRDLETFALRFTPRRPGSIWSEANQARVARLIRDGRMAPPGLRRIAAAKADGTWGRPLRPSRKPRMPQDLGAALQAEPAAATHFRAWGDSYQAMCVRWVLDARTAETRARRIRRVVERAAQDRRLGIEGF